MDTCGAEVIYEGDEEQEKEQEYEELQMEDLEPAHPRFEDVQPQVHDPMEEVNLGNE